MLKRFREWKDETHGGGFELVRHFLSRFFDTETVSESGEWQKVAGGLFAILLSLCILGARGYIRRYNNPESPAFFSAQFYHDFLREDILSFVGIAMALTALLTLLLWQSLFPTARDYLALAGLPVNARDIFRAKFTALLLLFAAFTLALTTAPAVLFAAVTAGRWRENPSALANIAANFSATAGACVFVFFGLLAIQGILLNLLQGRFFDRVSLAVQAALFIATVGFVPVLGRQPTNALWWPPVWFLRLWESIVTGPRREAGHAVLAIVLPAAVALLAYLLSYHRYRRLLLEAAPDRAGRSTKLCSRLLERWIGDPREQAAFGFIWKTLTRSRSHRLVMLAYAGIALGWIVKGALDTPKPSLRDEGMYGLVVALVPLALSMLVTVGLRHVFALPANWVFQTLDRDGRAAWLGAVERFVVWCGLAPIFLASLPAAFAVLGWTRAGALTALTFLGALLWFEAMFRRWQKLPFTCSYLPGKKPVLFKLLRYGLAISFLGPAGQLVLYCSGELTAFVALVTFLAAVWWKVRASRRRFWAECALCYQEAPDDAVMELNLQAGQDHAHAELAQPVPAGTMFTDTLVASRGLLPQAWAEEIEAEGRRPSLLIGTFVEDVKYGCRMVRRNPLFSSVVVLTLTVGIGINGSVCRVVNGFALRPHVYKDPESFLRVVPKPRFQDSIRQASEEEFKTLREHSRSLRELAAYAHFPAFIGEQDSTGSTGLAVSCNFFQVDGLERAVAGRLFTNEDCLAMPQAAPAVITEALWRARFGADPRALGRILAVNGRPVTIVGVVPNRTAGWTTPASIWIPYRAQRYFEATAHTDEVFWLQLAGRLNPGYSRSQAEAELNILAQQLDRLHFGRHTAVVTTDGSWMSEMRLTLTGRQLLLMAFFVGAFNLVMLISCANVATLLLSRAAARRREIAVRLSLGAARIRIVRMLVTESLVLASIAGAASVWLAWRLPEPLFRAVAGRTPDFPMPLDWRTFTFVAGAVMLTGILAGLAPALESAKTDLTGSLKGAASSGRAGRRVQGFLVSAQVAMSMVLLVGAALFAKAEDRTLRADPGYLPKRVVVSPVFFPDNTTYGGAATRLLAITGRIKALPGVRSVAFCNGFPLFSHVTVELSPPGRPDASQPVDVYSASPGFFETLGVPLLRGREFQPQMADATSIVVSESLARAFWRRQDPVGRTLSFPGGGTPYRPGLAPNEVPGSGGLAGTATVVGVVKDVDPLRFGGSENPALYAMWRPNPIQNMMSVRFDAGASTGAAAVRAAIREMDPNLIVWARLAQDWIDQITEELWNVVAFILILGVIATLLATSGIYGAVSFAVSQRTRELGIRVALGARRLDIVREVFVAGGRPVLQGLLAGMWLSVAVAAALRQGVKGSPLRLDTANPFLYCGAAVLLALAAMLAMVAPARRGANSDPLESLRCE